MLDGMLLAGAGSIYMCDLNNKSPIQNNVCIMLISKDDIFEQYYLSLV
jgi:hypothetical protein